MITMDRGKSYVQNINTIGIRVIPVVPLSEVYGTKYGIIILIASQTSMKMKTHNL